jgi:hypothetical protein
MKMRRRILPYIIGLFIIPVWSCGHLGSTKDLQDAENRILQQKDGTVSLILDKAACYNDAVNPSNNTADWNIVISKPGRFKVWLSSATKDTSDLNYPNSVRISLMDDQLEVNPVCDKIVRNSSDVHYPYFRADSYMGSIYVSEPGEYNIQLISEKVIAKRAESLNTSLADDTKLMSVILTPITR